MEVIIKNLAPYDIERAGRVFKAGKERHIHITQGLEREIKSCSYLVIVTDATEERALYEQTVDKRAAKIDVIIPVLDRQIETIKTLESLFANNENINVIIIDNDSDNLEYLKKFNVKVITNKKNVGVTKALNQGLAIAKSKYIVVMHNDIVVNTKDWIAKAISFMEENKHVGMVGQAGWSRLESDLKYRSQFLWASVEKHQRKPRRFEEVVVLDGCCNVLRNVGIVLDENLDYWFYDWNVSLQYRELGFKLYVMEGSSIHIADDRNKATINLDKCKRDGIKEELYKKKAHEYFLSKWERILPLEV